MAESNLKALHRLTKRADFERLKLSGKSAKSTRWLIANFQKNNLARIRVGWTVPTYVGKAVTRNRIKRWIREYLRGLPAQLLETELDVNLVFRKETVEFYEQLAHKDFDAALKTLFNNISTRHFTSR